MSGAARMSAHDPLTGVLNPLHRPCACRERCTDVPEDEDHAYAVCKGLPPLPRPPLVELGLVDRTAE